MGLGRGGTKSGVHNPRLENINIEREGESGKMWCRNCLIPVSHEIGAAGCFVRCRNCARREKVANTERMGTVPSPDGKGIRSVFQVTNPIRYPDWTISEKEGNRLFQEKIQKSAENRKEWYRRTLKEDLARLKAWREKWDCSNELLKEILEDLASAESWNWGQVTSEDCEVEHNLPMIAIKDLLNCMVLRPSDVLIPLVGEMERRKK